MRHHYILTGVDQVTRALMAIEELPVDPVHEVIIREYEPESDRSAAQNRLQFLWYNDAAKQLKDGVDYRAYCKLHFGVGIVKSGTGKTAEKFRDAYDSIIRPLSYAQKLKLMSPPIELPVTSIMTVKQMAQYLDMVQQHLTGLGVKLTIPADVYDVAMRMAT